MPSLTLFLVFASICVIGGNADNVWFVAHDGEKESSCGRSKDHPCVNLDHVIYNAFSGDTIYIMASDNLHILCSQDATHLLRKSLRIVGINGLAQIGCKEYDYDNFILKYDYTPGGYSLTMQNITLTNGALVFGNGTLDLSNVHFFNSALKTVPEECQQLQMNINNCHFNNKGLFSKENGTLLTAISIKCAATNIAITNSKFEATVMEVEISKKIALTIDQSIFLGHGLTTKGVSVLANDGILAIKNSNFTEFRSPTLTSYALNLFEAALLLRSKSKNASLLTAEVMNCEFNSNDRGLTIIGDVKEATIDGCTFTDNIAMHSGSSILGLASKARIIVTDSLFVGNKGGSVREHFILRENENEAKVDGDRIVLDNKVSKGFIRCVGRGGAIRLQKGSMEITSSVFKRNTANLQGGTIMVDRGANLKLNKVHVEGANYLSQAIMGDVLYSRGNAELHDVHVVGMSSHFGYSILEHNGDPWSLKITRLWFECPMGHNLRIQDRSSFSVSSKGLKSTSDMYDEMAYYCDPCPHGSYSFDHGYLNNTRVPKGGNSTYYSLRIDGEEADEVRYKGLYILNIAKCTSCPGDVEEEVMRITDKETADSDSGDYSYDSESYDSDDEYNEADDGEGESFTQHEVSTDDTDSEEDSSDSKSLASDNEEEEYVDKNDSKIQELNRQCPVSASHRSSYSSIVTFALAFIAWKLL